MARIPLFLALLALFDPARGLAVVTRGAGGARFTAAAPGRRRIAEPHMGRKGRPRTSHPSGGMVMPQQQVRKPEPPEEGTSNFYLYCRDESRWPPVPSAASLSIPSPSSPSLETTPS